MVQKSVNPAIKTVALHCVLSMLLYATLHGSAMAQAPANCSALANRFIATLNAQQQKKLMYDFDSDERYNWNFVPRDDRKGIMIDELDEKQQRAGFDLLKAYLSESGFGKSQSIIRLEVVLKELEGRPAGDRYRDPGRYAFIMFGKPSATGAWGWRFEGHHISFNFSTYKNMITASTPGFMGANPAVVSSGRQKGLQILRAETEAGFKLIGSLTETQLKQAVFADEAPADIITSNSRKALIEQVRGIAYSQLNAKQQALFRQLLGIYVNRYSKQFAAGMMQEIENAGLDKLHFAWAGARKQENGKPYYYCIQGPTIIIEYDNTQNNANHVHTVVRDLAHDFGGDELAEHYKKEH